MSDTEAPVAPKARKPRTPAQQAVFERMQTAIKEKRARMALERGTAQPRAPVPAPSRKAEAPAPAPPPPKPRRAHRAKKPVEQIMREAIEAPSSDDSDSGDSDNGDRMAGPLRDLYKDKYKEKYRQKYQARTTQQLTKGVAHTALRSRVDDEMHRLARAAIFGS